MSVGNIETPNINNLFCKSISAESFDNLGAGATGVFIANSNLPVYIDNILYSPPQALSYSSASEFWGGGIVQNADLTVLKVGTVLFIFTQNVLNSLLSNGQVGTYSVALPLGFRPAHSNGGFCPIWDNGVTATGYFNLDTNGVLTVGRAQNFAGGCLGFTASSNRTGISNCCLVCSLL